MPARWNGRGRRRGRGIGGGRADLECNLNSCSMNSLYDPERKYDNYYDAIYDQIMDSVMLNLSMTSTRMEDPNWIELLTYLQNQDIDYKWLYDLYHGVLIPKVTEFGMAKREEAERSKYRAIIDLDREQKQDIEEVVRLGYVQLYHRYESFRMGLIPKLDKAHNAGIGYGSDKIVSRLFNISLSKDVVLSSRMPFIYFVCQATKHTHGKPKLQREVPIPSELRHLDKDEKIVVKPSQLLDDIIHIKTFSSMLFLAISSAHDYVKFERQLRAPNFTSFAPIDQLRMEQDVKQRRDHCILLWSEMKSHLPDKQKKPGRLA